MPTTQLLERAAAPVELGHGQLPPSPSSDGGGGDRREFPLLLAVLIVVAVGALFTYLGMLTQIWANMSGAQLPGA